MGNTIMIPPDHETISAGDDQTADIPAVSGNHESMFGTAEIKDRFFIFADCCYCSGMSSAAAVFPGNDQVLPQPVSARQRLTAV